MEDTLFVVIYLFVLITPFFIVDGICRKRNRSRMKGFFATFFFGWFAALFLGLGLKVRDPETGYLR